MAKPGRGWIPARDELPDLDLELDHGHDHDQDRDQDELRDLEQVRRLRRRSKREPEPEFELEADQRRDFDPSAEFEHDLEPEYDEEEQFQLDLREVTPRVVVTPLLIGANVAIFAMLGLLYDVPVMQPRASDMLPWGANFAPYTTAGEWWRLFTCMFLHFGLVHLGFNMWILKEVGPLVERLVGNVGFIVLYLGSGLCASLASTWWNPESVSAGASGAIFGVIGALLGVLILGHGTIPKASLSRMRKAVGTFIFYNVYIGFSTPGIDMAAHLGGLGVGVLCGMIMTRSEMLDSAEGREERNLTAAAICGLCMMWMLVVIPDGGGSATKALLEFDEIRQRTDSTYTAALSEMERRELDDEEFVEVLEELLSDWRGIQRELDGLQDVPDARVAAVQRAKQYLAVCIEGREALVAGLRTNEEDKFSLWQDKELELDRLERDL